MWGTIPIGLKMLVQWMSVYTISWYRFLFSAMVLFPIVLRRYGFRTVLDIKKLPVLFAVYMLTQKQQLILFAPKTILLVIYFAGIGVLFPLAKPGILFEFEGYQLGVLGGVSPMTGVSFWSFSGSTKHIEASRSSAGSPKRITYSAFENYR